MGVQASTAPGGQGLTAWAAADLDAAFPAVVREHGSVAYSTALRLGLQPADAEDLAAETFARAYAAMREYPPERIRQLRLRPWLVTIALNLWRNRLRAAARRPAPVPLDAADPPDAAAGPEQRALAADGQRDLAHLLAGLPEDQRVPVVLRHVVGLTYDEIAEVLGCPVGTAKSHVSRGLRALRALLAPTVELEPEEVP